MNVRRVTLEDIDQLAPLFDGYMVFYRKPSNINKHRQYLEERISKEEAIIFMADDGQGQAVGFTLLYPTFSSVSMARVYTLNDLFVHKDFRKRGVASMLMDKAASYGQSQGAVRLHLETEKDNIGAQALYEKEGWVKETNFFYYRQL